MEVWYFLPNNIFPEDELRTGRWTKMCNEKHRNRVYYYYYCDDDEIKGASDPGM